MKKSYLSMLIICLLMAGCSSFSVQPWERDILARDDMALNNATLDSAFDDHIYFSKEASSGGQGFSGGGCGCN